ncbi:MAG: hypothetical protein KGL39_41165 [Patescibacteria group bacterium]|nr:hypothetical protein [Patescibacteria group bacterium]
MPIPDISRLIHSAAGASQASAVFNDALTGYLNAVKASDFKLSEELRPIVLGSLEAFMDEISAAHKQLDILRG